MVLVVVGGHSRNIGKTSVAAGIIRALPEARWTAVKITQYGHSVCSHSGHSCDCAAGHLHAFEIGEDLEPSDRDSGRFLAAGAVRSYWLRTAAGGLGHALEAIRRILAESQNVIIESNSILQYLRPSLYLHVADFSVADWKESARLYVGLADAIIVSGGNPEDSAWEGVPGHWLAGKPRFRVCAPDYSSEALAAFVASRAGLVQPAAGITTSTPTPPPG